MGYQINYGSISVLLFKQFLFYFIMTPVCKSSDAINSDMPKRSYKVLLLSEKVKFLNKERKKNTEVAKIFSKNESCIYEIVKKGKDTLASFAVTP